MSSEIQHLASFAALDRRRLDEQGLEDRGEWNCETLAADADDQGLDDGQRDWESERDACPASNCRIYVHKPTEGGQVRAHNVHSHAAPARLRHLLACGEAGREDEFER